MCSKFRFGIARAISLALLLMCILFSLNCLDNLLSRMLIDSIQDKDTERALKIINMECSLGFDVNTPDSVNWLSRISEDTPDIPLSIACRTGNATITQALLDAGASANGVSGCGWSPLMEVLLAPPCSSDITIVELLMAYGADPGREENGSYPILQAAQRVPCEYLLEPEPESSLHYGKEYDSGIAVEITEVFDRLAQHTDCHVVDSIGRNALHYAAMYGNYELVHYLLDQQGFDPFVQDHFGKTAYDLANECGYTELFHILNP